MCCDVFLLAGPGSKLPVAEVRCKQRGVHPGVVPEAEGELRAGPDADDGLHQDGDVTPRDFQAQLLTGGKNQGVCKTGKRSGGHEKAET